MAWYRTGTIAVTNGSPTVTGTGTQWDDSIILPGYEIVIGGVGYEIQSVNSTTSITLVTNFAGSTASGLSYAIKQNAYSAGNYVLDRVLEWINSLKTTLNVLGSLRLNGLITDPVSPSEGSMWFNSSLGVLKAFIGGDTVTLTDSGDLDAKSDVGHGHAITDTTGLQTALDAKANLAGGNAFTGGQSINLSGSPLDPAPVTGTVLHIQNADTLPTRILLDAIVQSTIYSGRRANGSAAAPTAVNVGEIVAQFTAHPRGTTAYAPSARTAIRSVASENITDTAQGMKLVFCTTLNGTQVLSDNMVLDQNGNVGIGTTSPICSLDVNGPVRVKAYTTATLPAASLGAGMIVYVTDANSTTQNSVVAGGGANKVLVFSDGTSWRIS